MFFLHWLLGKLLLHPSQPGYPELGRPHGTAFLSSVLRRVDPRKTTVSPLHASPGLTHWSWGALQKQEGTEPPRYGRELPTAVSRMPQERGW